MTVSGVPTPHRIAAYALTITFFILAILGLARNFRGDVVDEGSPSLRTHSHYFASPHQPLKEIMVGPIDPTKDGEKDGGLGPEKTTSDSYYVFLQKFPLENSWKSLFHTEVIVCPRETFAKDSAFLNMLDGLVDTLTPSRFVDNVAVNGDGVVQDTTKSPFVAIEEDQWSKQSETGCTQLGYGGANCSGSCCGSPHLPQNRNYALNSTTAVISNAMGEYKELYFYGRSSATPGTAAAGVSAISGDDAYKAVCHGHMNAIEMGSEPMCVSNWAGRD